MADSVSSTGSAGTIHYVSGSNESSGGIKVDTDMFLKLLVAQMQYQDPLEPQSNTQLVAELAQMSEMEQMQQMNLSLSNSQAYGLIGKYAYAEVLDSKTGVTNQYFGLVTSVAIKDGVTYAVMGDYAVDVSNITRVFDSSYAESSADSESTEPTESTESTQPTAEA